MRCCGIELTTPFCPQCGTKHNPPTLESLLAYLQGKKVWWEKSLVHRRKRHAAAMANGQASARRCCGLVKAATKMVERYQGWIELLAPKGASKIILAA